LKYNLSTGQRSFDRRWFESRHSAEIVEAMSAVVWITGLSGAGKTTLCDALCDRLSSTLTNIVKIDGDQIREVFGGDLTYKEEDRWIQIGRIQRLAKILSDQNLNCIVCALYSHPDLLSWNRDNIPNYFEVYLKASIDLVKDRDTKGLYGQAITGKLVDVVGVDIPWNEPRQPDLVINADSELEANVAKVLRKIDGRLAR